MAQADVQAVRADRILPVADETAIVKVLAQKLRDEGFVGSAAFDGSSGLERGSAERPDLGNCGACCEPALRIRDEAPYPC